MIVSFPVMARTEIHFLYAHLTLFKNIDLSKIYKSELLHAMRPTSGSRDNNADFMRRRESIFLKMCAELKSRNAIAHLTFNGTFNFDRLVNVVIELCNRSNDFERIKGLPYLTIISAVTYKILNIVQVQRILTQCQLLHVLSNNNQGLISYNPLAMIRNNSGNGGRVLLERNNEGHGILQSNTARIIFQQFEANARPLKREHTSHERLSIRSNVRRFQKEKPGPGEKKGAVVVNYHVVASFDLLDEDFAKLFPNKISNVTDGFGTRFIQADTRKQHYGFTKVEKTSIRSVKSTWYTLPMETKVPTKFQTTVTTGFLRIINILGEGDGKDVTVIDSEATTSRPCRYTLPPFLISGISSRKGLFASKKSLPELSDQETFPFAFRIISHYTPDSLREALFNIGTETDSTQLFLLTKCIFTESLRLMSLYGSTKTDVSHVSPFLLSTKPTKED